MTSESEQIISLYQRHAIDWDRERGRSLIEKAWLDQFLALLPPSPSILDIGCGAGEPISRYLIEQGCDVTGVDSSSAMIGVCTERFPDQNWIVSDMRTVSLDRRFDGILAWDSFFHLCPDDQRQMFPIFRKHAQPKAALMFTSGHLHGEAIGTLHGEPLYHGSLDGAEYRLLLQQNGFDVLKNIIEDPNCGYHTIWLAQIRSSDPDRFNDEAGHQ
jgi:SAM-dependent methyltransferase